MKNYLFIVEGQHDIAVLTKYLKLNGYTKLKDIEEVPSFWKDLIPSKFPHGGDLLIRVPVPTFFKLNDKTVAIHDARGESNIVSETNNALMILKDDKLELKAIGIFCDADNKTAIDTYKKQMSLFEEEFEDEFKPIIKNHSLGKVTQNQGYKFGVYIFPDNSNTGVLEDLLLEGAKAKYPEVLSHAESYIIQIANEKPSYIQSGNLKGSKRKKMLVGVIANALKPGKANQVSIQDNSWINTESMDNSPIQMEFRKFLDELLGDE